jgi:hypothetical protein
MSMLEWDQFKNDVFALGLTLLYAASFRGVKNLNQSMEKLT